MRIRDLNWLLLGALMTTIACDFALYYYVAPAVGEHFETHGAWTFLITIWKVFIGGEWL